MSDCDPMDCSPSGLLCPWNTPSKSEYLFLSPGNLPDPGIEPRSLALQANSLPSESPEKPAYISPNLHYLIYEFSTSFDPEFSQFIVSQ